MLAFSLSLITGWHALAGQWLPGDEEAVIAHPLVAGRPVAGLPKGVFYRPVRTLSLALDHAIWETNPAGYHLSNLVYHAASGVLVYGLARAFGLPTRAGLLACAVWVVHPVHPDAVTPVSGRREVLVALFYLSALLAYLAWREDRSRLSALGTLLASVLAAYTKEVTVTLPAVALACELALSGRRPAAEHLKFLGAWSLLVVAAVAHGTALGPGAAGLAQVQLSASFLVAAARAFARYLYLVAWPVTLSSDYSAAAFAPPGALTAACALASVALFVALVVYTSTRRPLAALALTAFALALAPALALVATPEVLAEHTLHLPLVALALLFAGAAAPAFTRAPRTSVALSLVLVLALGARTHARNREWHDWPTLVAATVRDLPGCARAHANLGLVHEGAGRLEEAESEYRTALALEPDDPLTLSNLGSLLMQRGRFAPARDALRRAVELDPALVEAQNNLGAVLTELADLTGAEAHIRRALSVRPAHVPALLNLGLVLRRAGRGRAGEAEAVYRQAIALDPDNASAYNNLGALHLDLARGPEAVKAFERAAALQPHAARGQLNLAVALASVGQARAAEEALIRGASLEPAGTVQLECARLALDMKHLRLARHFLEKAHQAGANDPELARRLDTQ